MVLPDFQLQKKGEPPMSKSYSILGLQNSKGVSNWLVRNGQFLLPMVSLIEASRVAIDELIDVLGRASIEAVLTLSARNLAGEKQQGRAGEEIVWYGSQGGSVKLSDRKLRVNKPRLRRKGKGGGEVRIPAYEAMNSGQRMSERLLEILMCNVSTRNYEGVIREMADTTGVSKSSVSREFVTASAEKLQELTERSFQEVDLLIIYLDGMVFGEHHVIGAVGVDREGNKHVLGLQMGASENAAAATALLEDLVERGVDPEKKYLFVIDGAKALRKGVRQVFGSKQEVQRCRQHKIRNVCSHLPDDLADNVRAEMKAAYQCQWEKGMARLKKQAEWLEVRYPSAAASLREGLEETFTINRLELSSSLRRCLGSTNVIESPHSGVRMRTRRVSRWRDGQMVLRWAATAFLETEKHFNRIAGYRDLWMLEAKLRDQVTSNLESKEDVA